MREKLRVWTEGLETFLLEVILEQRRGTRAALVRTVLYGCSGVFRVAIKARRFLYNVRILRDSTLGVQVIAIGNLTVGGTGKTPVVEKFARELSDQGRNVAILSRGYRSKPAPLHVWLLNKLFFRTDTTPRGSSRTANPCCSIPRWPAMNPTCSPPTSRTSWFW
jgi:tetraacyldisaccharide 4'-kinase